MNQYSRLSQDNRCTIRHIPGYNTVCTNSALITDPYIANNSGARSDINIIADCWCSKPFTVFQHVGADCHLLKNHAIFTDNRPLRNKNSK